MAETLSKVTLKETAANETKWPSELYTKTHDFLLLSTNFPNIMPKEHENGKQSLFVSDFLNKDKTKQEFLNTEVYLWLKSILITDEFTSFGWLTSKIHNCILDRPLPYRSQIKKYCENLFSWVEFYSDEIIINKHNKTKSLELKN